MHQNGFSRWILLAIGLVFLPATATGTAVAADGLIEPDGRWLHPQYLTYRPGHGQEAEVNPPRFSWPYVPHVIPEEPGERLMPHASTFTFQLAGDREFTDLEYEVETPYNFYNAFGPLEPGQWHWRVGYDVGTDREQWSAARSFTVEAEAPRWERTPILDAAERLGSLDRPRLLPGGHDWESWQAAIESHDEAGPWLKTMLDDLEETLEEPWWNDLPESDLPDENPYNPREWADIALQISTAAFAWRLTGDERFAPAKEMALHIAGYPQGGNTSPEYHGAPGARSKYPTQINEFLAVCYDLLYDRLDEAQRAKLREAVEWRLDAVFFGRYTWVRGDHRPFQIGIGVFASSHPYENLGWSAPAAFLLAGESEVADQVTELCLHYQTGVFNSFGPDEGWNQGVGYAIFKGMTASRGMMYAAMLLPELEVGRNPYLASFGDWMAHIMPLGLQRLHYGDYTDDIEHLRRTGQANLFRMLAQFSQEPRLATRWRAAAAYDDAQLEWGWGRDWLNLRSFIEMPAPEQDASSPSHALFPVAGWVMAASHSPSDPAAYDDARGMIFRSRPQGGYGHEYRSENDFVWYALGETLSVGGGSTVFRDLHSHHSMSHNVVLVNGIGQEWDHQASRRPFVGRLLAYEEHDGYTYWVGDATHAYQKELEGLKRWHRHVVFVDDQWFVIYDDLAMEDDAEPARFSYLFQVHFEAPLTLSDDRVGWSYEMGDAQAQVAFAQAADAVEVDHQQGRNIYVNPITGHDMYDEAEAGLNRYGRSLEDYERSEHTLWVTNREPARQWQFTSVLAADPIDAEATDIAFDDDATATLTLGDTTQTVSFAGDSEADIAIDVDRIRAHAEATDPVRLPAGGEAESLTIDGDTYHVAWASEETFDRPDWHLRWAVEGDSLVTATADGGLKVAGHAAEHENTSTVWYRPELPADAIVRIEARVVEPAEGNAANLNLFMHAREADGSPLRFGRDGTYADYHEIPNYLATFVGLEGGWSRLRRNPGFELLNDDPTRQARPGEAYELVMTVIDGRVRYYIDGQRVHDFTDDQPLEGGRLGLRTWNSSIIWGRVEVGRLRP